MVSKAVAASGTGALGRRSLEASSSRYGEKVIRLLLALSAVVSVAVTTLIVISLVRPTIDFFRFVSFREFFGGTVWAPAFANPSFGVWPIVVGTAWIVLIALSVSVPVGLLSAIYLSEYAPENVRRSIKPTLEVLEGIPTVATGLFGFWLLRPLAEELFPFLPWRGPFSTIVAGVAVGLIIVPLVASVSDDALRAVPMALREGAYALGANKFEVSLRVVFPGAISGIVAAVVLGGSRAVGETMVVLLVAGAGNPLLSFNPVQGLQTMTAFIAGKATGDIPTGTIVYDTIFAVGTLLFVSTLALNMFAIRFVRRFREEYD
ncbi:MAG: phosphate ABC transporter permease subunit PstC [Acidimicrobiia bacterium]